MLRFTVEAIEARIVVGERIEECLPQSIGALDVRLEARNVARVECGNLSRGALSVGAEQKRTAVEQRREGKGVFTIIRKAIRAKVELVNKPRIEQTTDVGGRRERVARPDVALADRCAADPFAALEDRNALAGASQQRRARQAIMAGADDDGVVRGISGWRVARG